MKSTLLFGLILLNANKIKAGWHSSCEVQGADRYDWLGYYSLDDPINDDHKGIIRTFTTKNIVALKGYSSKYLDASFENETLTIFPNENFTRFEEEYPQHRSSIISLKLDFQCIKDESETLDMRQTVKDVNNHDPVLNQAVYEYNFGLAIPQDYDMTKFLQITGSDVDFSNRYLHFDVGSNAYLKIQYNVEEDYYDKTKYLPTLSTLKEIKGPFRKEFTIVVKDQANPPRNTTALLVLTVTSNNAEGGNENIPHPPVFAEHLYFANYSSNGDLNMEKSIVINYGVEETVIKQLDHKKYFKIELNNHNPNILEVERVDPLPNHILDLGEPLIVEIEAFNQGLTIPGRTALIIRLPKTNMEQDTSDSCDTVNVFGFSNSHDDIWLILCLSLLVVLTLTNIGVIAWYFWNRRQIPRVNI